MSQATQALTEAQQSELARLKAYMPFRIVWGAVNPDTKEFVCAASFTKRQANDYARKGWQVFIATA